MTRLKIPLHAITNELLAILFLLNGPLGAQQPLRLILKRGEISARTGGKGIGTSGAAAWAGGEWITDPSTLPGRARCCRKGLRRLLQERVPSDVGLVPMEPSPPAGCHLSTRHCSQEHESPSALSPSHLLGPLPARIWAEPRATALRTGLVRSSHVSLMKNQGGYAVVGCCCCLSHVSPTLALK